MATPDALNNPKKARCHITAVFDESSESAWLDAMQCGGNKTDRGKLSLTA